MKKEDEEKAGLKAIQDAKKKVERDKKEELKKQGKWLSKKQLDEKRIRDAKEKEQEAAGFYTRDEEGGE